MDHRDFALTHSPKNNLNLKKKKVHLKKKNKLFPSPRDQEMRGRKYIIFFFLTFLLFYVNLMVNVECEFSQEKREKSSYEF